MRSVTICGSKRFKDEMHQFAEDLRAKGVLVFEPNFLEPFAEDMNFETNEIKKVMFKGLTLEHFDWIKKADVCFIYNKNNYVGTSVTMELAYANALGKSIFAISPETGDIVRDSLIDGIAETTDDLVKYLG